MSDLVAAGHRAQDVVAGQDAERPIGVVDHW
jgi:hypothetical protein